MTTWLFYHTSFQMWNNPAEPVLYVPGILILNPIQTSIWFKCNEEILSKFSLLEKAYFQMNEFHKYLSPEDHRNVESLYKIWKYVHFSFDKKNSKERLRIVDLFTMYEKTAYFRAVWLIHTNNFVNIVMFWMTRTRPWYWHIIKDLKFDWTHIASNQLWN